MNVRAMVHEILREGLDDWVPVDVLVHLSLQFSREAGVSQRVLFREVLQFILSNGLMTVGEIGESGYEAWDLRQDEVISEVLRRLDELNWNPQGGACWLANTQRGDDTVLLGEMNH